MEYKFDYDIVIIGAGPAGITAGIYAKRANLNVCLVEKYCTGGKVVTTSFVENYPGFDYIGGAELATLWVNQLKKLDIKTFSGEVTNIVTSEDGYHYVITAKRTIRAKAVIIATGMVNRLLNIPGEKEYEHKGISYCCICDGSVYKDKIVSIIGSGRSAVEEAIYMSDIAKKVYVISNKSKFKAEEGIVNNLKNKENVEIIYNVDTKEFVGNSERLTGILVKDQISGEEKVVDVDGSFTYIGFLPIAPTVNGESILDQEKRFIVVNEEMMTKLPGIFAAGDITTKNVRQITTAVGDGATAALHAIDYIGKRKW